MDRNTTCRICRHHVIGSLSARRAWIEIPVTAYCAYLPMVALRKESVDRNLGDQVLRVFARRRSPQGERG